MAGNEGDRQEGGSGNAAPPAGRVAVIIPFFQRTPGILRRAVLSVLRQTGVATPDIIVVDDGSPISARAELAPLMLDHAERITLIEQENARAGNARNAGLAALGPAVELVAFLDSDDEWDRAHLGNAVAALDSGFDLYFSDFLPRDRDRSLFRIRRLAFDRFPRLNCGVDVHHHTDDLFHALLMRSYVGLSTVVYRYRAFPELRFHGELYPVGEDTIFCMELARRTPRIAVSSRCEVSYGHGVNIYSGSGWGSPNALGLNHGRRHYHRTLQSVFTLSPEHRRFVRGQIKDLRRAFVPILMHVIRRRQRLDLAMVSRTLALDPLIVAYFPLGLARVVRERRKQQRR